MTSNNASVDEVKRISRRLQTHLGRVEQSTLSLQPRECFCYDALAPLRAAAAVGVHKKPP